MNKKQNPMSNYFRRHKESTIYAVVWAILIMAPVISMYIETRSERVPEFHWQPVLDIWQIYAIYFVAFIIHNFFIAPLLIVKKKVGQYFALAGILVVAFFFIQAYVHPRPHPRGRRFHTESKMKKTRQQTAENDSISFAKAAAQQEDSIDIMQGRNMERRHHIGPPPMIEMIDFLGSIMLILLLGLNIGVKLYFKQERDEKSYIELKQQHLQEQLAYLRYQINPHFFMNTLNNIHALIDIDPEKAKSAIVRLSRLMRYILYDTNNIIVPLKRELSFLNHYIALMKIRYSEDVVITVDIPESLPDCNVPPLLYVTFVENAFKHGISYEKESFIYIEFYVADNQLVFHCTNSQPANRALKVGNEGGVGLTNVRRRLHIIYGSDYKFTIKDSDDQYEVILALPFHPTKLEQLTAEMPQKTNENLKQTNT